MKINVYHNNYVKEKVRKANNLFVQLYNRITDPEVKEFGKTEVIKLAELYSTLDTLELFCFTHEDFERFNNEYVDDAKKFYYIVYKMIKEDDRNTSYIGYEYEEYEGAYKITMETLNLIK